MNKRPDEVARVKPVLGEQARIHGAERPRRMRMAGKEGWVMAASYRRFGTEPATARSAKRA